MENEVEQFIISFLIKTMTENVLQDMLHVLGPPVIIFLWAIKERKMLLELVVMGLTGVKDFMMKNYGHSKPVSGGNTVINYYNCTINNNGNNNFASESISSQPSFDRFRDKNKLNQEISCRLG